MVFNHYKAFDLNHFNSQERNYCPSFIEYAVARRRLVNSLSRAKGIGNPNPVPPLFARPFGRAFFMPMDGEEWRMHMDVRAEKCSMLFLHFHHPWWSYVVKSHGRQRAALYRKQAKWSALQPVIHCFYQVFKSGFF